MFEANGKGRKLAAVAAIALVSACLGMLADWRVPAISRGAGTGSCGSAVLCPFRLEIADCSH